MLGNVVVSVTVSGGLRRRLRLPRLKAMAMMSRVRVESAALVMSEQGVT